MILDSTSLALFILLAILAEVLGTVGGFGSSLFFVPVAGMFLDFHSVLGITALFHLSSNLSKIALFRKGFDKRLAIRMGLPAVAAVIIGAWMSKFFDAHWLAMGLAVFLLGISLTLLLKSGFVIKPSSANAITGGVFSGLTAGLIGTGGAIRGIVLTAFKLDKEVFIATSAIIDLGIDFSRSIVYFNNGFVHTHDLYLIPILLGVSIAGTYLGKKILNRVSQEQFRSLVLALIFGVGLLMLTESMPWFTPAPDTQN